MNSFRALASDLRAAARAMPHDAQRVLHRSAGETEASIRSMDGTSEQVVVTFPGDLHAHLQGVGPGLVSDSGQGASSLADVDLDATADSMSSGLADAGLSALMKGRR